MANNRLLIYCKKCLKYTAIAKYYPLSWFTPWPLQDTLNDFFDHHGDCLITYPKMELGYKANIWGLTTESTWSGYMDIPCHQLYRKKPDWWNKSGEHNHQGETLNYRGDDQHTEDLDCWCHPEQGEVDGDNYILHRNEHGHTILNDPKLAN